jgi:hypothetical protein
MGFLKTVVTPGGSAAVTCERYDPTQLFALVAQPGPGDWTAAPGHPKAIPPLTSIAAPVM